MTVWRVIIYKAETEVNKKRKDDKGILARERKHERWRETRRNVLSPVYCCDPSETPSVLTIYVHVYTCTYTYIHA